MRTFFVLATSALLLAGGPAAAQIEDLTKSLGLGSKTQLSTETVASGLKEALKISTGSAVSLTGKSGGYFTNEAIKILMPQKLASVEKGLRAVGYGPQIDEFVLSMNRSAEKAAPAAKDIFWGAIKEMSFDDARKILGGGDTAATEYFKEKTTGKLTEAFRPVVEKSMDEVGVTRQYNALVGQAQSLPFVKVPSLDLNQYVVGKALDGLFLMMANEERKIRKDPAARVTELLKTVFAN
jgi:hypothetical protein